MNEGRLSAQVAETASQASASTQLSNINAEVMTQNVTPSSLRLSSYSAEILTQIATESSLQVSSLVLEVLQPVPRVRARLLPVFN